MIERKETDRGKGLVFIVDDEKDVCYLLKRMLASNGFLTKCCYSLQMYKNEIARHVRPEFMLLDINLSDGSGLSLLDDNLIPTETKVIVMSARSHLREKALAKGADRFIAKPFSPSTLLELIENDRLAG